MNKAAISICVWYLKFFCEKMMLDVVAAILPPWGDKCEDESKDVEDAKGKEKQNWDFDDMFASVSQHWTPW